MRLSEADQALLWDMVRHAELAVSFVKGMTLAQYLDDSKTRLAVERSIEVIGEAAREVSEEVRRLSPTIPWRKKVSQRHVLAHDYGGVDHTRIWEVATQRLPELHVELFRMLESSTADDKEST